MTSLSTEQATERARTSASAEATSSREWLAHAAEPGRTLLRTSAVARTLQTVLWCGQWAGLALVAQACLTEPRGAGLGPGLVVLLVCSVLAALAGYAADTFASRAGLAIEDDLRVRLVSRLLPRVARPTAPEPATAAHATLELVDDVAEYHATTLPQRYSAPASMLIIFVLSAIVHWPVAVILALSTLVVFFNLRLAGLLAKEGNDRYLGAIQKMGAVVLDSFRGVETLRRLHAVEQRRDALAEASDRLTDANMSVLKRAFISGLVMDVVITFSIAVTATYVGLALLRYVSIPLVAPIELASGLFVLMLCPLYFSPMRQLASAYHDRERAESASRALVAVLAEDALRSAGDIRSAGELPASAATSIPWSVELRDVVCTVDDRTILAVSHVVANAGRWTVITGSSGAGKSTLLRMMAGLHEPSSGTIRWVSGARSQAPVLGAAAWIGQGTVILEGTIAGNIRLARPDADDDAVRLAADAAGLTPLLTSLPAGLETAVGENGFGLSTGEARRVAIARAFVRGSKLWILDEPTAHLDHETAGDIVSALRRATVGCTVVVATHSAGIARVADSIWTVSDGRVTDVSGTPVVAVVAVAPSIPVTP